MISTTRHLATELNADCQIAFHATSVDYPNEAEIQFVLSVFDELMLEIISLERANKPFDS